MTRDEAIKIVARGGLQNDPICMDAAVFVDLLRYLRVLKLDEPKSVEQRAIDMIKARTGIWGNEATSILASIDEAGLKIVEK